MYQLLPRMKFIFQSSCITLDLAVNIKIRTACTNLDKWADNFMCARGVDFVPVSFLYWILNCSFHFSSTQQANTLFEGVIPYKLWSEGFDELPGRLTELNKEFLGYMMTRTS